MEQVLYIVQNATEKENMLATGAGEKGEQNAIVVSEEV